MTQILKLNYFYIIVYIFIIIFVLANNKIKADQEFRIFADTIFTDNDKNFIKGIGKATIFDDSGSILRGDEIIYYKDTQEFDARGNVIINDKEKNTFFIDELIGGTSLENLSGKKVKIRFKNEARLVGSGFLKKNNLSILTNAEFTPCKKNNYLLKNCPGWKMRANKIYHDEKTQTMHYDHARLHLFNIPIFYLPYFSHPDPSVKKRTGFLMPTIQADSQLGDTFSLPFFYNIKSNQDMTFVPTIQSNANNFYSINYRQLGQLGLFDINASVDDNDDKSGTSNHLFLDANINNPFGRLDLEFKSTNNDTYLRKNKINRLTVLNTGIEFERNINNSLFLFEASAIKHLTIQDSEQWEYIYPKIVYNLDDIENNIFDGSLSINNELLFSKNLEESKTSLISSQGDWRNFYVNRKNGLLFNNEANLRLVSIAIDNKDSNNSSNLRIYPQISTKISYPLIKVSKNSIQTLTPSITPILSPYNNYTDPKDLTNSNLFSLNRATSIKEWESGPRINYGLEWFVDSGDESNMKITIGQNYRFNKKEKRNFSEISDYFVSSNVSINKNNYFNNSFIIDREDIDIKSINMNAYSVINDFKLAIDYDYASKKYSDSEEQISIGGEYKFANDFFLRFTGSKNIDTNKNIGYQYGILYENDCLGIDFNYYRDLTKDRDIEESDGYSFTIVLKPFGSTRSYGKNKVFGPQL